MKFSTIQYLSEKYEKHCSDCGRVYRAISSKWCEACVVTNNLYRRYGCGQLSASMLVNRAVKKGDLRPVRELACVDCGAPARAYEHRDYNKPLDVEPVCSPCNGKRGYAIPLRMTFDEFMAIVMQTSIWFRNEMTVADFEPIRRKYFKESPCA